MPKRPRSYFLSFETGLADLSDAVVAALPAESLRTGVGVESIAADPEGGYRLELSDGGADVCDAVVLAAPAFAAAALLRGVAPAAADGLETIPYVSTATVSLAFRQDQLPGGTAPRGFGFVVPRAEKRGIMATTYSSSKFPGRAPDGHVLVRSFVGRAGREEPAALPDQELIGLVRSELFNILEIQAEPLFTSIFRWPRGMPQYRVGHRGLVDGIEAAVAAAPGVEIAGGYLHGIGIGDCIREGAAAAQRALAHLAHTAGPPVPTQSDELPAGDGIGDEGLAGGGTSATG